ncbi:MAG: hypothetical protein R2823_04725 [Acidimicrobiia bacterium]
MSTSRTLALAATAAVALALIVESGLASASAEASPDSTETHCVVDVIGEEPDGELILSEARCYKTFSEAVSDASDGVVRIPAGAAGAILFQDEGIAEALSSFTLGTHYDGYNGSGSSISIAGSSCSGGYWNTGTTWRNRISSSHNGCGRLRHYDYANKGGSYQDTYGAGTTDNLGSLNNRTESVSYHAS